MFKRRQNACCVVINDDFEIIGRNIYTESMLEIKQGFMSVHLCGDSNGLPTNTNKS